MDQGVIRSLKAHYRKSLVRVIFTFLLKAMQLIVCACNDASKETVINCFQKAIISKKDQINAVNDVDDPLKKLKESLEEMQTKDPSLVPENMTV